MFFGAIQETKPKPGERIYSFGQISEVDHVQQILVVNHGKNTIKIRTCIQGSVGQWIRFVGTFNGQLVECTFCESIDGVDTNLLMRAINKLANN